MWLRKSSEVKLGQNKAVMNNSLTFDLANTIINSLVLYTRILNSLV